jgi:hypothetical protein
MPEVSLTGVLVVADIGMELGQLNPVTGTALVVAGLFSVVLFPLGALMLMRADKQLVPAER